MAVSPIDEALAKRWDLSPEHLRATIRSAVFRRDADKASDADLLAVMMLARQHDLNPFTGEIQAFMSTRGMNVIIPHGGWTRIVTRDPRFERVELVEQMDDAGRFLGTTSRWFLKDRGPEPVAEFTAWLSEWARDTEQWKSKPRHMCGIKAYNHGAKRALGLGQVYDEDDAERIRAERPAIRAPRSVAESQAAAADPPPAESLSEASEPPKAPSLFPDEVR